MSKKDTKIEAPKNDDITNLEDIMRIKYTRLKNHPEETKDNIVFISQFGFEFHFNKYSEWKIIKVSRDNGKTWNIR